MRNPSRKIAFVLAASDHGTIIVNRFDYHKVAEATTYGVGHQILENSSYDLEEVDLALLLLEYRRKYFGDGVVAIDCGANIGVHTIEWARRMTGWGSVTAIEAQERIFYALAGNIAINNCFNARAIFGAVAAQSGVINAPQPEYRDSGSFGSLELRKGDRNEFIGQKINYDETVEIRALSLDSLGLERIDLVKIDVEGMELEALAGAGDSIRRCRPILIVESIKSDQAELRSILERFEYRLFQTGLNFLAIHTSDRTLTHIVDR